MLCLWFYYGASRQSDGLSHSYSHSALVKVGNCAIWKQTKWERQLYFHPTTQCEQKKSILDHLGNGGDFPREKFTLHVVRRKINFPRLKETEFDLLTHHQRDLRLYEHRHHYLCGAFSLRKVTENLLLAHPFTKTGA